MRGLTAPRPRNDSPAPLVSRAAAGIFSGLFSRRDAPAQLSMMATNGTVFGIVDKTAPAVAKTDWRLYRSAKSGKNEDRVEVTSHAALDVIDKPNKFFSRMELFETAQQHLDLPGEACLVVGRDPRSSIPLELWPVRPDRIDPVPHPEKYLTGWIYTSPDGERIPLRLDEVIHVRRPNPMDPYRGLGPVGSVLTEATSADYAAQWNANFFRNSAEPGGVIQVEKVLSDTEFDTLSQRWDEQHRGMSRAHRVAILEGGMTWVDRKYTMRDMQFVELRGVTRDAIMEAYGFPKSMLGISENVNRANAESGEYVFAKWLTVPRLDRWRDALNTKFLPLFGDTAKGLEFDYDSPVPEDATAENDSRTSKADAAQKLIAAGYDGDSVKEALELPDALVWEKPAPQPAFGHLPAGQPEPPIAPDSTGPTPAEPGASQPAATVGALLANLLRAPLVLNADGWPESDPDTVHAIDISPLQAAWETALAALLNLWNSTVVSDWINQLVDQIRAVLRGDGGTLASLTVDTAAAGRHLADAMAGLAETAAGHAVAEAAAQDVTLSPAWPTAHDLAAAAEEIAALEGQRYALTAGREAARVRAPGVPADDVVSHVESELIGMSDAGSTQALGGALTEAEKRARISTFRSGPSGALYASERNDSNTCRNCREIDGRFICTTDDLAPLYKLYPVAGYIDCLGRWRCRGTLVGVWRPATTEGGQ